MEETQEYRDVLERLDAAFPGRELLTKAEIAGWMGIHISTVTRRFRWPRGLVAKTTVARAISEGG
ncbi:MAG: hypothetical protein J6T26_07785 [Firmicutes bacterium]|nr:hypothetical protein [Bacillota bacterium]